MELQPLKIGELCAKIPVIQGGMGVGVSLSGLAGAVAGCGGIGVISAAQIGFREADFDENPLKANLRALKAEIKRAKELAPLGVIGVNIMVAMRYYEEYVRACIEAGADLIISGAGIPAELPGLIGDAKIKLAPIVSSVKSANVICKLWDRKYKTAPDMVVIEGPEAGGHLGFSVEDLEHKDTLDYDSQIRQIIEKVREFADKYQKKIPVVAAGGIYDRADMERVMALGVDGVQMATRFVTTYECDADDAFKQSYIAAKKEDIVITKSPVGMPGRAIRNSFLETVTANRPKIRKCHLCLAHCKPSEIPYCITDALINSVEGRTDQGLLFCGSNAYRAKKLEHVSEVFAELMS